MIRYNMKIGIDASRANRGKKTGVEWYAWHVIQEMKKIKTENTQFVLYSDKPLLGELARLPENWESRVLKWPPKRFWTQIRLSWEMFKDPPDVLFIPAHVFPIIHPEYTVMTLHDIAALELPESYNCFERWYSLWSAKYAANKLWKVIVPSFFVKKEVLKLAGGNMPDGVKASRYGKFCDNIFVIYHGYDKNYRVIENEEKINKVLAKYKIKKPFLLSVGRLEEKKNTSNIVKMFDLLCARNDCHCLTGCYCGKLNLVLAGKFGYGYEKVERAVRESNNRNRIIMPGYVAEEDIVYIMNAAEAFVFPSLHEGFGLPALEAMACGIPVIVSQGGSLEEICEYCAVYADPNDIKDMAKGVRSVICDKHLRCKNIKAGLERVKNFNWGKCAAETFLILSEFD